MKRDHIRKILLLNVHYPFKTELHNSISSFASSDLRYHSKPQNPDYKNIPHASLLKSSLTFKCALVKLQDRFQRRQDVLHVCGFQATAKIHSYSHKSIYLYDFCQ